jgi:S1-C subfamily serine protease
LVFPTSVCRGSRPSWPREIRSLWRLRIYALNYFTGLAKGEIASLSGAADDPRYFQISVPVQPGNSGGALVDERGNVIGIVSAKLDAGAALAASGALPENVNYAVKSSLLLSFLESVPDLANKLKAPVTGDRKFEEVVKSAQDAAVLVLVY